LCWAIAIPIAVRKPGKRRRKFLEQDQSRRMLNPPEKLELVVARARVLGIPREAWPPKIEVRQAHVKHFDLLYCKKPPCPLLGRILSRQSRTFFPRRGVDSVHESRKLLARQQPNRFGNTRILLSSGAGLSNEPRPRVYAVWQDGEVIHPLLHRTRPEFEFDFASFKTCILPFCKS